MFTGRTEASCRAAWAWQTSHPPDQHQAVRANFGVPIYLEAEKLPTPSAPGHLAFDPFGYYFLPWVGNILHHFATMGTISLLLFIGESSFQGFLGGAGCRPSTVFREDPNLSGKMCRQWRCEQLPAHGHGEGVLSDIELSGTQAEFFHSGQ